MKRSNTHLRHYLSTLSIALMCGALTACPNGLVQLNGTPAEESPQFAPVAHVGTCVDLPEGEMATGDERGCTCPIGATRQCYPGDQSVAGIGACTIGKQKCLPGAQNEFGSWGPCENAGDPGEEQCDGLDNDCDGRTDERCACIAGEEKPCGIDVGECKLGKQICDVTGTWSECVDAIGPQEEDCDNLDDDCDGEIAEGCECIDGTTEDCGTDVGICETGTRICTDGSWDACEGQTLPQPAEYCDGELDDDCDGKVDEGCACTEGDTRPCGTDVGVCELGSQTCDLSGQWSACAGGTGPQGDDICDGIDRDCDGKVNEGCACVKDQTRPCGSDVGECRQGSQTCDEYGHWSATCDGEILPAEELCDGVRDEDCDGVVDEGCACTDGETRDCGTDVGICEFGSQTCDLWGQWSTCAGGTGPEAEEFCDGVDRNCNGKVNEGCQCIEGETRPCGSNVGACEEGTQTCDRFGNWSTTCNGEVVPTEELCDDIDNNCNGSIDEDCGDACFEVPTGYHVDFDFNHMTSIRKADVTLLVDVTGSMAGEIAQIKSSLVDTIIPGLLANISEVNLSVASLGDFPVRPYGGPSDEPFTLHQVNTSNGELALSAVQTLSAIGGADGPESQVEALYQLATAAGIAPWVAPQTSCPAGTAGYVCYRPDATPVIVLLSDAPFHNGPLGDHPYDDTSVAGAHTYADAVSALNSIGAKVVGVYSGVPDYGRDDLAAIARDTGASDAAGEPIVVDIEQNGAGLSAGVIDIVGTLVSESTTTVDVVVERISAGPEPAISVAVTPLHAIPADGATKDGSRFVDVKPGTKVFFTVTLSNDGEVTAQSHLYRVRLRKDGAVIGDETTLKFVVPGPTIQCPAS